MSDKKYWERIAKNFSEGYNIKSVLIPSSLGLVNWCMDLLMKKSLKPVLDDCRFYRVLDVGCGVGRWSLELALRVQLLVGIDIALNMVKEAKTRLLSVDNALFIVATASNLPFKDSSFDSVLSVTVLQHITNRSEFIKSCTEIVRVTKSRGKIILLETSPKKSYSGTLDPPMSYYSKDEFIDLFVSLGTELESIFGVEMRMSNILILGSKLKALFITAPDSRTMENRKYSSIFETLKYAYYIVINGLFLCFLLPLNLLIRNTSFFKNHAFHNLFIFRKKPDGTIAQT